MASSAGGTEREWEREIEREQLRLPWDRLAGSRRRRLSTGTLHEKPEDNMSPLPILVKTHFALKMMLDFPQ